MTKEIDNFSLFKKNFRFSCKIICIIITENSKSIVTKNYSKYSKNINFPRFNCLSSVNLRKMGVCFQKSNFIVTYILFFSGIMKKITIQSFQIGLL